MESTKTNTIKKEGGHSSTLGTQARPPVVVIMGHIDHGKSTLLDYIRKTNVVDSEAGGITQRLSAYEVVHKDEHGTDQTITFLDTPGHEAFMKMRERGIEVADIAVLVVSAEDGVKPQTLEAWKAAEKSKKPCIVAINKIDKPDANIDRTKQDLAENGIYLENYGGSVPVAMISAKIGTGVDDLLSLILILSELEDFRADSALPASGFVIESHLDSKRGIAATLVIKNGTLKKGEVVAAGAAFCPVRIMENYKGEMVDSATFSSPVRLVGFDKIPVVGTEFLACKNKNDAQEYCSAKASLKKPQASALENEGAKKIIPIVLKADASGMMEAIEKEIAKSKSESAEFRIVQKGVGPISENDIKGVAGKDALVIGFNVKTDRSALDLAEKWNIPVANFDIIYKLTEWLALEMEKRRPRIETTEITGQAKIQKTFSKTKERQIVGGKVLKGSIALSKTVKILRRDFEIGRGKIVGLEKNKSKTSEVEEGNEFGAMIEGKIEIVPGDTLEAFSVVQK